MTTPTESSGTTRAGRVRVHVVGAGPGAADLITLRGARCLAQAEVVLHDALIDADFRSLAPQARWVDVGKRGFGPAAEQAHINAQLLYWAERSSRVVRLKGGDPSVFGRLEEELQALAQAGIACEVVPGVTAALAAAAQAQRPLTRRGRGRSVALVTATTRDHAADAAAAVRPPAGTAGRRADTEVFYMAGRQLGLLQRRLLAAGWRPDTAVSVVSRAGCADALATAHRLHTLTDATPLHAGRPTVVTIGVGAEALSLDAATRPAAPSARSATDPQASASTTEPTADSTEKEGAA